MQTLLHPVALVHEKLLLVWLLLMTHVAHDFGRAEFAAQKRWKSLSLNSTQAFATRDDGGM